MREHNLARLIEDMPDDELRAVRHDAAVGLSLLRPGSGPAPTSACSTPSSASATAPGSRPDPTPGTAGPLPAPRSGQVATGDG
ncbi:MAG: hypothetical protein ACRDOL_29025 [Streptosporangiaceae bacterium]